MRKLLVILGVPVEHMTMQEALARCDEFVAVGRATGRTHQIATVKAGFIVNSLHDPELRRILQEAEMATADGLPLVWASHLLKGPLPGRVTGADLIPALAERAAAKGYSIFFLGGRPGVAIQASAILAERYPGLRVAGVYTPPPASVLQMDRAAVERVIAAKPDILLVAFGNPQQEKWIRMYAPELHVPVAIGVGDALERIVSTAKSAPAWMQRLGIEWLHRLARTPWPLFTRSIRDGVSFGYFVAHQWWAMRQDRATSIAPAPVAPAAPSVPVATPAPPATPAIPADATTMPVLRLCGRLDVTTYEPFVAEARTHLDAAGSLVIEMDEVEFVDSTAMGALVALANQARASGGVLYLVAVPKRVGDLMALVRLDRFFEILPDRAAAELRRSMPETSPAPHPLRGGWLVVKAPRIFDAGTAPVLLASCEQRTAELPRLIVDLTDTVFLASAGMAALIRLDRGVREHGGELRVAGCSPDVLRTLKLVKLDALLKVYPTTMEAMSTPMAADEPGMPSTILHARS